MDLPGESEQLFAALTALIALEVEKAVARQMSKRVKPLAPKEVEQLYRVSRRTLSRRVADKRLANVGSERRPLYDAEEVAAQFHLRKPDIG